MFSPHGEGGLEEQLHELTNVEQHDLRRLPSRHIKGCGRHAVDCLLSRER
jgi:hypothetical protein